MIGLIMGPQGCGKGTQAKFIEKDCGYFSVSTGDIMRAEREKDTERGRMIKKLIDAGNLVPTELTNKLAHEEIEKHEKVLFDGYPRSLDQAEYLIKNFHIDFAVLIKISEEETVKRLSKRRICTATKKIFIADQITDEDLKECEKAGGEIVHRDDDKPEAIKKRLQIYHDSTMPVIDFLRNENVPIIEINGEQSVEDVYADIKKELSEIIV